MQAQTVRTTRTEHAPDRPRELVVGWRGERWATGIEPGEATYQRAWRVVHLSTGKCACYRVFGDLLLHEQEAQAVAQTLEAGGYEPGGGPREVRRGRQLLEQALADYRAQQASNAWQQGGTR